MKKLEKQLLVANGKRVVRLLDIEDVENFVNELKRAKRFVKKYGGDIDAKLAAGRVANSYKYPARTTAAIALKNSKTGLYEAVIRDQLAGSCSGGSGKYGWIKIILPEDLPDSVRTRHGLGKNRKTLTLSVF